MHRHALARNSISTLILSQLGPDAQLFFLDPERMVFRDYSSYTQPTAHYALRKEHIPSAEYVRIMRDMITAGDDPQSDGLLNLMNSMDQCRQDPSSGPLRIDPNLAVALVKYFPQNCLAYIGGTFFAHYIGATTLFDHFEPRGRWYRGDPGILRQHYSPTAAEFENWLYTTECGLGAEALVESLRQPNAGRRWLYCAPVICGGNFCGVLYRFASDQDTSGIEAHLEGVLRQAESNFQNMYYGLIADVVTTLGVLDDPFEVFLRQLCKYFTVAVGIIWASHTQNPPLMYKRQFPVGRNDRAEARGAFRELPWIREDGDPNALCKSSSMRTGLLGGLERFTLGEWVDAVRGTDLLIEDPSQALAETVANLCAKFGMPIGTGFFLPGGLVSQRHQHRLLELYFFAPGKTAGHSILRTLVPLLQEIMILYEQAERHDNQRREIIARVVNHEVGNYRGLSSLPAHVRHCLRAVTATDELTVQAHWGELKQDLIDYFSGTLGYKITVSDWPPNPPWFRIRAAPDVLYLVCAELIRNQLQYGDGGQADLSLEAEESAARVCVEGAGNVEKLRSALLPEANQAANRTGRGLSLIRSLLRHLWDDSLRRDKILEVDNGASGSGRVRTICRFPV
jgi:hypothetical protein